MRHPRIAAFALIAAIFFAPSAHAGQPLDIEAELAIPGVKLLVVDFYASWCPPCVKAIPKWEALRQKYGAQGLRLVAVAVNDQEALCEQLPWTPDKIVCDTDRAVATRFGVEGLPAAFLWNWQGEMLGNRIHPEDVEKKIDAWMAAIPRVSVEVVSLPRRKAGTNARELERLVASELNDGGKLTVVASAADRKRLRELAKESYALGRDEAMTCALGKEVSANNLLEVSIVPGNHPQLRLGMLSAESHCRTRDVSVAWDPKRPGRSVTQAVTKLMGRLRRAELQRPAALQVARNLEAGTRAGLGASAGETSVSSMDSYEAMLEQAREAEARAAKLREELAAREAKEKADREAKEKARAERLEKAWTAVSKFALTKSLGKSRRAQAVKRFTTDFPRDNPHLDTAHKYLARLEAGKEPGAAPDGMVEVPGGAFYMGCNEEVDSECYSDEKPGRTEYLPTFFIDRTEVTVNAYAACVRAGRCSEPKTGEYYNWGQSGRGEHPINGVDWNQATEYCAWKGHRLPSEPEWEKAARGTDGRKYAWGNAGYRQTKYANIADETAKRTFSYLTIAEGYDDGFVQTAPVESFPRGESPYGALDMMGNVWEWTSDWYSSEPKSRVSRGGSWDFVPAFARASARAGYSPSNRGYGLGFRCAHSDSPEP